MPTLIAEPQTLDIIFQNAPYFWIISGLIFIGLEFIFPGTFIMFLGIGGLITGIAARLIPLSFTSQAIIWMASTLGSLLIGGHFVRKLFKSEKSVDPFVKDDYLNQIVSVEQDVLVGQLSGKVRFQGTVWDAISTESRIPKGEKVRILKRENLTFIVEKVDMMP